MESSDLSAPPGLFSHPYEREVVSDSDRATEPVQLPVFSDGPES